MSKKRKEWVSGVGVLVRDSSIEVIEPTTATEFEVQAYVWHELRRLGYQARGEVKCIFAGRSRVRFDVAIFIGGKLVAIVEIKKQEREHVTKWGDTRQGSRYAQFNVPIHMVYGQAQAEKFVADIESGAVRLTA